MSRPSILVAGVGNIFFGDDGFGVAVARRLLSRPLPPHVRVVDFGIRGMDLAYALLDPYELIVLVDAVQVGARPGALQMIALDEDPAPLARAGTDSHGMVPARAVELACAMGARLPRMILVGCEPADFGAPDEGRIGLSPVVEAAIAGAVDRIEELVAGTAPAAVRTRSAVDGSV